MEIGWLDWIIAGSVVNLFYYVFNLDYLAKENNLKKIEEAEAILGKSDKITKLKEDLKNYNRNIGLVGLLFDIVTFPFVVVGMCVLLIDKLADKKNNKSG